MIEGVDYSDSRPSPSGLVAVGKLFAGRYVGAGSGPKLLQADEAQALSDAGLKIVSLVEGASDGALGGRAMGIQHAEQARQWHVDRGFPWPVPCYFAVDFDVQAAQWATVRDYFQGVASTIGLPYTGIYGGLNAMRWAQTDDIARWFFQTYAWSAGTWDGGLHIEQYHNDVFIVGGTVDLDRALTPDYGGWDMTSTTPPSEATQIDQTYWTTDTIVHASPTITGGQWKGQPAELGVLINSIAAGVAKIVEGLSTPVIPPASSTVDLSTVAAQLDALQSSVDGIEPAATVDAVAIGKAMIADPSFVADLAQAVAAQLAQIQLSITLSGSATGGVKAATA